jgi:hypothetical protein
VGLGLFNANFNGCNLNTANNASCAAPYTPSNTGALQGIDYGIVNSGYVNGGGNGGVKGTPLLRNSVTFLFNVSGAPITDNIFRSAYFQYSSAISSTSYFTDDTGSNYTPVPEPSMVLGSLLLGGAGGFGVLRRRIKGFVTAKKEQV